MAIFKREDKTFEVDEMADEARWSYYISSYTMRDLTEGIDLGRLNWPFLKRNMPPMLETEQEYNRVYTPQWNADELVIRISPNNYHLQYEPLTQEWWVHDAKVRRRGLSAMQEAVEERRRNFSEKFGPNGKMWMADLGDAEAEKINRDFHEWVKGEREGEPEVASETNEDADAVA
jgi:paired amphipathic helix protein Sin3a